MAKSIDHPDGYGTVGILEPLFDAVLEVVPPQSRIDVKRAFYSFMEDRVLVDLDVHFRVIDGEIVPVWEVSRG